LAAESLWDLLHFPLLRTIINKFPPALAAKLSRTAAVFQGLILAVANTVANFRHLKNSGKNLGREVVFDSMQHLDDTKMLAEATDILIAGSDTTAFTLAICIQEMMENPTIFEQLRKELKDAGIATEHDFELVRLEQIPYLVRITVKLRYVANNSQTACVKEALRYAMAVPGRLPRVVPGEAEPLIVDGKAIPTGTIIGMSAYTMHFDQSIWGEDARSFNPARWLKGNAKELDNYLVTFSKGARQCLGINIAYAEITLTLAILVKRFRFTPDKTLTKSDVRRLDYFVNAFEGTGIRAIVYEDET
jgi:cytochrome P450